MNKVKTIVIEFHNGRVRRVVCNSRKQFVAEMKRLSTTDRVYDGNGFTTFDLSTETVYQ